jgi:SAM-dependent methyltransferase
LLVLALLNVVGQGMNTLDRLTSVERERDRWQRAPALLAELRIRDGSRVVDFGCGAGYFALKLSTLVGAKGTVQAVDILRLPLFFLRIRAFRRGARNLNIVLGEPDDPHITAPVDAVLVANTWHELSAPAATLEYLRRALVPGGRLVIADRAPQAANAEHAIDPSLVEAQLRQGGFAMVGRDSHFLDQPDDGPWWLLVAEKLAIPSSVVTPESDSSHPITRGMLTPAALRGVPVPVASHRVPGAPIMRHTS